MRKFLKGTLWVLGILGVVVLLLRLLFFKTWTVPQDPTLAGSLAPTLEGGDVVLVLTRGDRTEGDLVRCTNPEDKTAWVMGRIYAGPKDRVRVENGYVNVNGRRYRTTESCLKDKVDVVDSAGVKHEVVCSRVEFAGGWHFVANGEVSSSESDEDEHTVGDDRVYLISDNRNNHQDSRDYGAVHKATCNDKIVFRLWGKNGFFDDSRRFEYIR